jgi:hypothetical protein
MGARAEGKSRVHHDDRSAGVFDALVMRADPKSRPEPHRMEVTQPLPLPGTIGYLTRL